MESPDQPANQEKEPENQAYGSQPELDLDGLFIRFQDCPVAKMSSVTGSLSPHPSHLLVGVPKACGKDLGELQDDLHSG